MFLIFCILFFLHHLFGFFFYCISQRPHIPKDFLAGHQWVFFWVWTGNYLRRATSAGYRFVAFTLSRETKFCFDLLKCKYWIIPSISLTVTDFSEDCVVCCTLIANTFRYLILCQSAAHKGWRQRTAAVSVLKQIITNEGRANVFA